MRKAVVAMEALPTQHGYCAGVSREAPQATASEVLAQGPYVTARAGFEPATLRTKGFKSTNEPPRPQNIIIIIIIIKK